MDKKSEAKIQSDCVIWLWNNKSETRGCFFVVNNNSDTLSKAMFQRAMGLIAGVSDTIFVWQNMTYFVEFKRPGYKQSDEQIKFQNGVQKQGMVYIIIHSIDEFKSFINGIV